jgi:hypothetical protein
MNLEVPETPDWLPVYIRLPRSGSRCPVTNLTRTAIDQVVRPQPCNNFKPPVRSRVLKARNATRGVRLVEVKSLLDYINDLPDGAEVRDAE